MLAHNRDLQLLSVHRIPDVQTGRSLDLIRTHNRECMTVVTEIPITPNTILKRKMGIPSHIPDIPPPIPPSSY